MIEATMIVCCFFGREGDQTRYIYMTHAASTLKPLARHVEHEQAAERCGGKQQARECL